MTRDDLLASPEFCNWVLDNHHIYGLMIDDADAMWLAEKLLMGIYVKLNNIVLI
mgnify:CR=1 FL=1